MANHKEFRHASGGRFEVKLTQDMFGGTLRAGSQIYLNNPQSHGHLRMGMKGSLEYSSVIYEGVVVKNDGKKAYFSIKNEVRSNSVVTRE